MYQIRFNNGSQWVKHGAEYEHISVAKEHAQRYFFRESHEEVAVFDNNNRKLISFTDDHPDGESLIKLQL